VGGTIVGSDLMWGKGPEGRDDDRDNDRERGKGPESGRDSLGASIDGSDGSRHGTVDNDGRDHL